MNNSEILWPLRTRFIHWSLALIVLLNGFFLEEGDPLHRYIGYGATFLVIVRLFLGFKGFGHENFRLLPLSKIELRKFCRALLRGHHLEYEGHNPLASLIYFAIWGSILLLGITGLLMGLDAFWGNQFLEETHGWISNVLLILVGTHLVGLIVDELAHRKNRWISMITGKKP